MHCPTLAELPMPPKGKKGWPWTEKSHQLPNNLLNGRSWPKISIVTPSYNQGQFIEETIRSVLLQSYPNIEYFVIDGGSNDESLEIIQKYEPWITYWVSESDNGQTNAINKGFKKARGEIVTWLNSDDLYTVNTLFTVAKTFIKQSNSAVVYGNADIIDTNTSIISHLKSREFNLKNLYRYDYIRQPASFIKTEAIEKIGYLNEKFHYTMDYDLWIRLGQEQAVMRYIPTTLAWFRLHKNSKSISQFEAFWLEEFIMLDMALKRKTPDASIAGIAYSHMFQLLIFLQFSQKSHENLNYINKNISIANNKKAFFQQSLQEILSFICKEYHYSKDYYTLLENIGELYQAFNTEYNKEGNNYSLSTKMRWVDEQLLFLLNYLLDLNKKDESIKIYKKLICIRPTLLKYPQLYRYLVRYIAKIPIISKIRKGK